MRTGDIEIHNTYFDGYTEHSRAIKPPPCQNKTHAPCFIGYGDCRSPNKCEAAHTRGAFSDKQFPQDPRASRLLGGPSCSGKSRPVPPKKNGKCTYYTVMGMLCYSTM